MTISSSVVARPWYIQAKGLLSLAETNDSIRNAKSLCHTHATSVCRRLGRRAMGRMAVHGIRCGE
ncbi:MAG: hypothetical protein IIW46_02105 [Bacteroidaceae bacterium]|nr:hypothetical protein [Bacteroidaceae bacterium]